MQDNDKGIAELLQELKKTEDTAGGLMAEMEECKASKNLAQEKLEERKVEFN